MKTALIGANGYIGKHLAFYLSQKGWDVHGYGRGEKGSSHCSSYNKLDVGARENFRNFDPDVDFVFYFSGLTGTFKSFTEYESYIDVNEKGLLHVLDKLRSAGSKARVIFPSSRLVYKGIENTPLREDAEKEFKTIYAITKWFGEKVLEQYASYFDIPFSVFRICVPYGNLFDDAYSYGTIGFFLSKAKKGEDISLFGDGNLKRTFTHVEDICQQIYLGITNRDSLNKVFNIGGETFSLKDVATSIAEKYGVRVVHVAWPETDAKLESGDTIFDAGALQNMIRKPLKHNFSNWLSEIK